MDFRKVLPIAFVLLVAMVGLAGVVTYLSNNVTATATVSSPIEVSATASVNGEEQALDAIAAYGGETIVLNTNTKNLSSVSQTCDLTLSATPSMQTTDGELTTKVIKTVALEAYAEEANVENITLATDAEPTTYTLNLVCNVAATE